MTRDETVKLLSIMKTAYPSAFRNMSVESGKALLELWTLELKPYPSKAVTRAATELIETSKYMPAIAEMLAQIRRVGLDMQMMLRCDLALGRDVPLEERRAVYDTAQATRRLQIESGKLQIEDPASRTLP